MSASIYRFSAESLDEIWSDVLPWINSALETADGKYPVPYIYDSIKRGDMQLWLIRNGAVQACVVTRIEDYPGKRVCDIFIVAGHGNHPWPKLYEEIERWAKSQGCKSTEANCRPGWEKVMGWEKAHIVLRKQIT